MTTPTVTCHPHPEDSPSPSSEVSVPAAVPGTRFACGTRFGSPAEVSPPEDGVLTASAARQPSSAGEAQPLPTSASWPDRPTDCRPRRNQSDSTASKMGSRLSSPRLSGMITPREEFPSQPYPPSVSGLERSISAGAIGEGAPRRGCEVPPNGAPAPPSAGCGSVPKGA